MGGSSSERVSARGFAYIGLLATDGLLVLTAALLLQLPHAGFSARTFGFALLLSALHASSVALWLKRRFSSQSAVARVFLQAWFLGTTAFPLGGLSGALALMHDTRPYAGASFIFIAGLVLVASLGLGGVLASWFMVVVIRVINAESSRARDGKQLVTLALVFGWAVLAGAIPPYTSEARGRYTGVLVRTDPASGAREILERVP